MQIHDGPRIFSLQIFVLVRGGAIDKLCLFFARGLYLSASFSLWCMYLSVSIASLALFSCCICNTHASHMQAI